MKIVAYYRVSTKKQGASGLGLGAQKKMVTDYAALNGGTIIAEYTEVEKGRLAVRPQLMKALDHTRGAKATLVVAKIDRLSRSMAFMAPLMESGVDFIACDNPHATKLTIHILTAMAEHESVETRRRTKDALGAAKAKGIKLGSSRPGHWEGREHLRGWKKGAKVSAQVRHERSKATFALLWPKVRQLREEGLSIQAIADKLAAEGYVTSRGLPIHRVLVFRILKQAEEAV